MFKKGDILIYTGESNEDFDTGQEVTLIEDLSEAAKAGMNNTPEQILISCMYFGGKRGGICGVKLIAMSELKLKV